MSELYRQVRSVLESRIREAEALSAQPHELPMNPPPRYSEDELRVDVEMWTYYLAQARTNMVLIGPLPQYQKRMNGFEYKQYELFCLAKIDRCEKKFKYVNGVLWPEYRRWLRAHGRGGKPDIGAVIPRVWYSVSATQAAKAREDGHVVETNWDGKNTTYRVLR